MAFALSLSHLMDGLKLSGCPICRLASEAAEHSVASFLWENVNDPTVRKEIIRSFGFCPEHTRLLVAKEMMESATVLGVNIIYEQLGRVAADELRSTRQKEKITGGLLNLLKQIGNGETEPTGAAILQPSGICPICAIVDKAAQNALADLFDAIQSTSAEEFRKAYLASDGVCLGHLRLGFRLYSERYPQAADFLLEITRSRLEALAAQMKEYIRKNNWEYRDEKLTKEESEAWRKMLTIFTGLPGHRFNHHVSEF